LISARTESSGIGFSETSFKTSNAPGASTTCVTSPGFTSKTTPSTGGSPARRTIAIFAHDGLVPEFNAAASFCSASKSSPFAARARNSSAFDFNITRSTGEPAEFAFSKTMRWISPWV